MSKLLYNIVKEMKNYEKIPSLLNGKNNNLEGKISKGQLVTGLVISAGKSNVINIFGRDISVSKTLLNKAEVGDEKTFQVFNITKDHIELKLLNSMSENIEGFVAVMKLDKDKDLLMSRRSYNDEKEIQQEKTNKMKAYIEGILSRLTEKDIAEIEKEGISVEKYSIESLSRLIDNIKSKVKQSDLDKNQEKDYSKIFSQKNSKDLKKELESLLEKENLPVTKESIQKLMTALSLYDPGKGLDEKSIQNLIRLKLPPTIENIYKAGYIGDQEARQNATSNSYTLTQEDWEELKDQVIISLEESNVEASKSNMDKARWLIDNDIPLSLESLSRYSELEEVREKYNDADLVIKHMIQGMKEGIDPKDTLIQEEDNYESLVEDIKSIEDQTVINAVEEDQELNLSNLVRLQESERQESKKQESKVIKEEQLNGKSIRALRQMEEIRLKMTADAANRLEKRGIHIDYEPLERVVEELRDLEETYYKEVLEEAEVEARLEHIEILKETRDRLDQLKGNASYILGRTLDSRYRQTITSLSNEGDLLHREISKAGEAYEQLMTLPSSEYGDSIHRAFANIDHLLNEMNLPDTRANQRAIRILGYNTMDITKENIDEIKDYDMEVNTLFANLHPSNTVKLIREGINPLNIPINELNKLIDGMEKEEANGQVEKYSTYLQKLDRQGEISPEERKSYIGIYRLLYSIEKSDGAALGALVKANGEVTLGHLLTAVRTLNKGSLDAQINDDFGPLEDINYEGEKIKDQVETAYRQTDSPETSYISQSLKAMYKEITPEHISHLRVSDHGVWEEIKDIPVDQVFDKFSQYHGKAVEEQLNAEKLMDIQEVLKGSDQAVEFLSNLKIPCSTVNIALANQTLTNDNNLYKKLSRLEDEEIEEKVENSLKEFEEIADKVFDKEILEKTYKKMEQDISQSLDEKILIGKLDSTRLAEIRNIQMQLPFVRNLAEKEVYQIPIKTEEGIWNINLTIHREKEKAGRVSLAMESQALGNIRVELSLKDSRLKGYIGSDDPRGLDILQSNMIELHKAVEEGQIELGKVEFSLISSNGFSNLNNIYMKEDEDKQGMQTKVTEKQLYLVAQGLVKSIRNMKSY